MKTRKYHAVWGADKAYRFKWMATLHSKLIKLKIKYYTTNKNN